ncbi:MAG: aldehyde ferredoxin oxidoreductase N-terminal domain-containing protein [Dehalococcoidales bacterium]|jgi:aldehyde:ferredoxin oxidoreductase
MAAKFGYAGKILKVDLSSASISDVPTSDYADRFIGGRGIAAKIYWDEVPPKSKAFDPENRLMFMTGPLSGYPGIAGSISQICGKSAATNPEQFFYTSMAGSWGAHLKFAGYDGVVAYGKSEKPVYLLVQDGKAELRDASALWGKESAEARDMLKSELGKSAKVLSTGPAGENLVPFATTLAEEDAAAWGGAIMGSKKLKAIVVRGKGSRPPVANPEKLEALVKYLRGFGYGAGYGLDTILDAPSLTKKQQICYGCVRGCGRSTQETADGIKAKFTCQSGIFYLFVADAYYGKRTEVPFQATRLCLNYGVDTHVIAAIMSWLMEGYSAGVLTEENTGIPLSKCGSWEFIETLVRKIALREGFGDVLAKGLHKAADSVGGKARELVADYIDKNGQRMWYSPRQYNLNGIFYATEPRMSLPVLHEMCMPVMKWNAWVEGAEGAYMSYDRLRDIGRRFWGSELTFDFSTYEGKAVAAKKIQDRIHVEECLILCAFFYPLRSCDYTETHEGDPTIESKLYSAVTGNETDEEGLNRIGERVFNLERAALAREDPRGRKVDELPEFDFTAPFQGEPERPESIVPGKDGEPITKKGNVVDREKFAKMMSEYYELRGWDSSGLQTKQKLAELDLKDITEGLAQRGLIV